MITEEKLVESISDKKLKHSNKLGDLIAALIAFVIFLIVYTANE